MPGSFKSEYHEHVRSMYIDNVCIDASTILLPDVRHLFLYYCFRTVFSNDEVQKGILFAVHPSERRLARQTQVIYRSKRHSDLKVTGHMYDRTRELRVRQFQLSCAVLPAAASLDSTWYYQW